MEAWIKYKGDPKDNYCRFGRVIPHIESKVDLCKYFGVNPERAKYIAGKLISDSRIECKLQKSASDSVRKIQEEIEVKAIPDEIKEDVKKRKPKEVKKD